MRIIKGNIIYISRFLLNQWFSNNTYVRVPFARAPVSSGMSLLSVQYVNSNDPSDTVNGEAVRINWLSTFRFAVAAYYDVINEADVELMEVCVPAPPLPLFVLSSDHNVIDAISVYVANIFRNIAAWWRNDRVTCTTFVPRARLYNNRRSIQVSSRYVCDPSLSVLSGLFLTLYSKSDFAPFVLCLPSHKIR